MCNSQKNVKNEQQAIGFKQELQRIMESNLHSVDDMIIYLYMSRFSTYKLMSVNVFEGRTLIYNGLFLQIRSSEPIQSCALL